MKLFRFIGMLAMLISSFVYGDCFEKDNDLVETLKNNHVRLIVLYNYEGTTNLLGIVTADRSPGYSLSKMGMANLENDIPGFAMLNINAIYTAPAYRTQQTAHILGVALGLAPKNLLIDMRLSTQNFGKYDGLFYNDYKHRLAPFPELLEATPPNGESGCAVYTRMNAFLNAVAVRQNETIVVITHAFNCCHVSKMLTGSYGSLPQPGTFHIYDFTAP